MIGSRLAAAVTSALIFTVAATCNAVVEELFWGDGSNGPLTSTKNILRQAVFRGAVEEA